ncbi:MAG: CbiX/SirB N-terminal domain-containing protein [Rhodocyclales bacterium]|nr:CbiX/SirB N-terminal domain-containing protein [Rhodocyclales bacterium]
MEKTALILFAHGARDPEWASPMRRVRAAILEQSAALRVELAFLEFMSPDLETCAATLAGEGYATVVVVPMFIAQGGHLKNDVPLLMERLRDRHPEVCFALAAPVGEAEPIVRAMAAYAAALAGGDATAAG